MTQVMVAACTHAYPRAMTRFLDNRGLEPPMPMVRTLEALEELPAGEVLTIHNDRVPIYLFPHLVERGAAYRVHEQEDGSARVEIDAPSCR